MQSKNRMNSEEMMKQGWQAMKIRLDREMPQLSKFDGIAKLGMSLCMLLVCFCAMHQHEESQPLTKAEDISLIENNSLAIQPKQASVIQQIQTEESEATQIKSALKTVSKNQHSKKVSKAVPSNLKRFPNVTAKKISLPRVRKGEAASRIHTTKKIEKANSESNLQASSNVLSSSIPLVSKITKKSSFLDDQSMSPLHIQSPIAINSKKSKWNFYTGLGITFQEDHRQLGYGVNLGVNQKFKASKWSISYEVGYNRYNHKSSKHLGIDRLDNDVLSAGTEPATGFEDNANSMNQSKSSLIFSKENQIIVTLLPQFALSSRFSLGFGASTLYLTNDNESILLPTLESRIKYRFNNCLELNTFWQKSIYNKSNNFSQFGLMINYNFN